MSRTFRSPQTACFLLAALAISLQSAWGGEAAVSAPSTPAQVAAGIDRLVVQRLTEAGVPVSPAADDAEFLRRVSLDLTGRIPTVAAAREFLDSASPHKRRELIETLLSSQHYGTHFGTVWNNLFIGREDGMARPPDTRKLAAWLTAAFQENRPWDRLVTDLLTSQGSHLENPATIFYTLGGDSRGIPRPEILTGTLGQLFLGVQLQCAECHDHPFSRWKQQDFWGLAAFFSRVQNVKNAKIKDRYIKTIAETPLEKDQAQIVIPDASFSNAGGKVAARLPFDQSPQLAKDALLREQLSDWLTDRRNPFFARNMMNRLWSHLLGRGLVMPLNDMRADNPPTHPELLDLLAEEFVQSGFDQQHMIRCICLTAAYQRSSRALPENQDDDKLLSRAAVKVVSPEMLIDSLSTAVGQEVLSNQRPKMDFRNPLVPLFSPREEFIRLFRTRDKEGDPRRYTHGVPQVLFLLNRAELSGGTPVVQKLCEEQWSLEECIQHLYLATLSRPAGKEELAAAVEFANRQTGRQAALDGVLWSLLVRSEFIVNH